MLKYFYLNGKIMPIDKPVVFINDLGILRGYGVFDFLQTYNGKPFGLKEHYQRLVASAKILDLKVPATLAEVEKAVLMLLKKNKVKDASFRFVLTPGSSRDGLNLDFGKYTFAILAEELYSSPGKFYKTGAKLVTFEHLRQFPESKNINYIQAVKLQKEKNKKGAIEVLYKFGGRILECTRSNFFLVKDGVLITPAKDILKGLTRDKTIQLAKKSKIKVEERDLAEKEILIADEAFITTTSKKIMPIVEIDGKKVGDGKVGPITKNLMKLFDDYTGSY